MRRALTIALGSLLIAGCTSRGPEKPARPAGATPTGQTDGLVPGPVQVAGRVVGVDLRSLSVMIELAPFARVPADFKDRILISRRDDLTPTSRLQASAYLRGRILGARLMAGKPQLGDEVVFAPTSP